MFARILSFRAVLGGIFLGCLVLISSCDGSDYAPPPVTDTSSADLRFREFYQWIGGEEILGPVISTKFTHADFEYQYTEAALLMYSGTANSNDQYQVAPLGLDVGVATPPTDPSSPMGHKIHPPFEALYIELGGARMVGLPLHPVQYNPKLQRFEQYFENLGFFQSENDPEGTVKLIAIGAWKCGAKCDHTPPNESQVQLPRGIDNSVSLALNRLDPSFTGLPLTEPFVAADGITEQIFENVAVCIDPDFPAGIRLRPLLKILGVNSEPGNFEIPTFFQEYLNRNSGLELSGQPISKFKHLSDNVFRQCFENLCLDYRENFPEELQVRPAPLGYSYKNLFDETQ